MKCLLALSLFLFLIPISVQATTYTAASCSSSDVNAKIALTVNGDTVLVPGGTCTWGINSVTISSSQQITLNGQGTTTINFASSGSDPGFGNTVLTVTTGSSNHTFLTGFTFNGAFTNGRAPITINNTGSQQFRIYGNILSYSGAFPQGTMMILQGDGPGLIDHNTLTTTINFTEMIHNFGSNSQTADWSSDIVPGSYNAVYIETNTFTGPSTGGGFTQAVENFQGAKVVFRYNTMNNTGFDAHGGTTPTGINCSEVNTRWVEAYNNTWTTTQGDAPTINVRGGSGVIFNNTHPSASAKIQLQADCLSASSGVPYPYQDQDGRGITTSSGATTTNASPIYIWNNNTFSIGTISHDSSPTTYIQLNRDYFVSSSQPTLTRCQSAADVIAGCPVSYTYTPAAYPHPLATTGGGGAASCSQSDVQAAITSAVNGATVQIPGPCTTSWSSFVTIPNTKGITIQPSSGGVTIGTTSQGFSLSAGASTTRITGFTCNNPGNVPNDYDGHCLRITSAPGNAPFRIDNWTMCSGGGNCTAGNTIFVSIFGNGPGVFDHNTVNYNGSAAFQIYGSGIGCDYTTGAGCGWNDSVVPGGSEMLFLETNTFKNTGCVSAGCNEGSNGPEQMYGAARVVMRYNTFITSALDVHGSQGGGIEPVGPQCPGGGPFCEGSVGTRWVEMYNNNFVNVSGGDSWYAYADIRAGSGVFFNNTISGTNTGWGFLKLREENTCSWPNGFQIGAGINGFTANPSCSNHYATCGSVNTAPFYLWNNSPGFNINVAGTVQLNRDYFVSANQPAVIHWMEQSGDTCSTIYNYVPYTYPHPLVSGGSSGPTKPNPPTGVSATPI